MWRLYSDVLDFLSQEEKRIYVNIYRHFYEVEGGCYVAKIIFLFPTYCLFIWQINASKGIFMCFIGIIWYNKLCWPLETFSLCSVWLHSDRFTYIHCMFVQLPTKENRTSKQPLHSWASLHATYKTVWLNCRVSLIDWGAIEAAHCWCC